jgi:hypothetical protein
LDVQLELILRKDRFLTAVFRVTFGGRGEEETGGWKQNLMKRILMYYFAVHY